MKLLTNKFIIAAAGFAIATSAQAAQIKGPSSSASPYVIASNPSTTIVTSILTVGDDANPAAGIYRMVGIPDGMGAYDNNNGTFTVLLNHELGSTVGLARAHGAAGSFVSQFIVNKADFSVLGGSDLIQQVSTWNAGTSSYNAAASGVSIGRLCSGDLAPVSAYFNSASGLGAQNRIFMSGEEVGPEGRVFGHVATGPGAGISYELPRLGKFSWENGVANPGTGNKTAVLGTDDATPGQVYLYLGDKTNTGNDIARAGLTNGSLYGIRVSGAALEDRTNGIDGVAGNKDSVAFTLQNFGNVENTTGAALQLSSTANNVTQFLRPEDIAWDLNDSKVAYFVTTDRFSQVEAGTGLQEGKSRLWKLAFASTDFTLGGTVSMLLEGSDAGQMFDNLTVTAEGQIIIQEDPGNQAYLAKTWTYDLASGTLVELLISDPARFAVPTAPFSQDEESSGVIDISDIMGAQNGEKFYLGNMQAHYGTGDAETVEGGQLYVAQVSPVPEPSTYAAFALGAVALVVLRRRRA